MSKERTTPRIIHASEHGIDLQSLDDGLLAMLASLRDAGYDAYLVGGCIRDLLSGVAPKDFDVVTDARPEQIKKVFPRKSMIIGRRFALVHVRLGWNRIIEVATFRGKHADRVLRHKIGKWLSKWWIYGSMESDVWRRDATINALYMSFPSGDIYDYTGGYDDIQNHRIQMIGDAATRYQEDPVRILRVIRLQAKLGFKISKESYLAIQPHRALLQTVSPSRMYGEFLRTFHGGFGCQAFDILNKMQMLRLLVPKVDLNPTALKFVRHCLANADARVAQDLPLSASFLYAIFLWYPLQNTLKKATKGSKKHRFESRAKTLLQRQHKATVLPKRVWFGIVQIWRLQSQFMIKSHRTAAQLMSHTLFRAAYDFLILRAAFEPALQPWVEWWALYIDATEEARAEMVWPEGLAP